MSPPDAGTGPDRFTITVDGAPVPVRAGQTVAGAMLAAGRRATRLTRFAGRPRGVFCGIGLCFDCLVVCNGERNVLACQRTALPDDSIDTGRAGEATP